MPPKNVSMPRGKYVAEHKRLVKRLEHPTKAGLKAEAIEQRKDLQMAKKINPGPKREPKNEKYPEHSKAHEKKETKAFERKEHRKGKK